jgi:hypothetical protein
MKMTKYLPSTLKVVLSALLSVAFCGNDVQAANKTFSTDETVAAGGTETYPTELYDDLTITDGATVDFDLGAIVGFSGNATINNGGTAVIKWNGQDQGTPGNYGGFTGFSDNVGTLRTDVPLTIDNGTVKFELNGTLASPTTHLYADSFNIKVDSGGGTVDVGAGFEVRGRTVTGSGPITKTGDGTLLFGNNTYFAGEGHGVAGFLVDGTVTVKQGTLAFGDRDTAPPTPKGTYAEAGSIVVDGSIDGTATLDIRQGALLNIVGTNTTPYTDIIIKNGGTLKLDSTVPSNTGIIKEARADALASKPLTDHSLKITVNNGKIISYRNDGSTATIATHHGGDHIDTLVRGNVGVEVAEGVTLVTGELTDGTGTANAGTATITKTGAGTYKTVTDANLAKSTVNVEEGEFVFDQAVIAETVTVTNAGSSVVFSDTDVTVGELELATAGTTATLEQATTGIIQVTTSAGSIIDANGDQSFLIADIRGDYNGNGSDLTIARGFVENAGVPVLHGLEGNITGVKNLIKAADAGSLFVKTDSATTFTGDIIVGGGSTPPAGGYGILNFEDTDTSDFIDYNAEHIIVENNASLAIGKGALINLTNTDPTAAADYSDIQVGKHGQIILDASHLSELNPTGVIKGSNPLEHVYASLADGSSISVTRSDDGVDMDVPYSFGGGNIDSRVTGNAAIFVTGNTELATGDIVFDPAGTGANIYKFGDGNYKTVGNIDLGDGSFDVEEGSVLFDIGNTEYDGLTPKADNVTAKNLILADSTSVVFNDSTTGIKNVIVGSHLGNGASISVDSVMAQQHSADPNAGSQTFQTLTLEQNSTYIGNGGVPIIDDNGTPGDLSDDFELFAPRATNLILTGLTTSAGTSAGYIDGNVSGVKDFTATGDLIIDKHGNITNSGVFTFSNGTLVIEVADHDSTVDTDYTSIKTGTFVLNPANSKVQFNVSGTGERQYKDVIVTDDTTFKSIYEGTGVFDVSTALREQKAVFSDDGKTLSIEIKNLTVGNFINSDGRFSGGNARRIAQLFDQLNGSTRYNGILNSLSGDQLRSVIQNSLGGEIISNATQMSMSVKPFRNVFRHLDETAPLRTPFNYFWGENRTQAPYQTRGQVREGFNLWFDMYAASEDADSDGETFDGYSASRYGMVVGGDIELYRYAIAGVVLGYGNPSISNDAGKVTADDISFGLYFRTPLVWDIAANLYMGYGSQEYSFKNAGEKKNFNGDSLALSAEFSKELPFSYVSLIPLLAVDFQRASSDEVTVGVPGLGMGAIYGSRNIEQTKIRVGLNGKYKRLRTRLQYGHLMSGDKYVITETAFTGNPIANAAIRGVNVGEDWFNLGLGGELFKTNHWRFFADYDLDVGKEATSHTGSVNVVFSW